MPVGRGPDLENGVVDIATERPITGRLYFLTFTLFISYLCVSISLPVVPLLVTGDLGLNNGLAGLAVGAVFFSTIVSRARSGRFSDLKGAKPAALIGLGCYALGALISLIAGVFATSPEIAYAILIVGRLIIGIGESLVSVSIVAWGIFIVGPERSGRVMALVGAALYGGFAVGGPIGIELYNLWGFTGAMAVAIVLPVIGIAVLSGMEGSPIHPDMTSQKTETTGFWKVLGTIKSYGAVLGLQGVGFAAIGAFFALFFRSQGWEGAGFGLTAFGGGFVLVRFAFGHLPDRIGGLPVSLASMAVETVGQFLIWTAATPTQAFIGAFLTGLGCSLIYPGMGREVVRVVPRHLLGIALGGFSAFQDLAYGLTGPIVGVLADRHGYGSVFLIGFAAAILGLLITLRLQMTSRRETSDQSEA